MVPACVLVVDDNPSVQRLLRRLVEGLGLEAVIEGDGRRAVRVARQRRPDLILIDMRLPGLDGLEAVRQIRRLPALVDTPIIALTGYSQVVRAGAAERAGCDAFFSKPLPLEELRATIGRLLDPKRRSSKADPS